MLISDPLRLTNGVDALSSLCRQKSKPVYNATRGGRGCGAPYAGRGGRGRGRSFGTAIEPMELPLAALVLRIPQNDLSDISVGVGELSERDGNFTMTLPPTPAEQASHRHTVIFGYLLDYSLL